MTTGQHAKPSRHAAKAAVAGAVLATTGPLLAVSAPAQADTTGPHSVPHLASEQTGPKPIQVKAAETATKRPDTYTVKAGDTLEGIARKIYGDAVNWLAFWQANAHRVHNADYILPGQQLLTPAVLPTDITVHYSPAVPKARLSDVHAHAEHLAHLAHLAHGSQSHAAAPVHVSAPVTHHSTAVSSTAVTEPHAGVLTRAQVEALWVEAGGPAAEEVEAANVAYCESGFRTNAYNPSGATGLWQILGAVLPGNLDDPLVNARNAVSKFEASGGTWAQWVCQP